MLRNGATILRQLGAAGTAVESAASRSFSSVGNFTFSSTQDAPTASLSSSISVAAKKAGKGVEVTVSAGGASVKAKYDAAALRKLATKPLALQDVARISVLHSSLTDYLLRLTNERYNVLAQWPDFTAAYGKDFYYRAHPADLKKFYESVDEFHRMYDVVTEFESLSALGTELIPAYRKRRQNVIHPAVGPTTANAAVAAFFLSHAK